METPTDRKPEICNCLALRQAARHVTQFYDRNLAEVGLRTTQYSILAKLNRHGPLTIGALADDLVMDRTTLGRNIKPLERDGLIVIEAGRDDRRSRQLQVTEAGRHRLQAAGERWARAQAAFEAGFGHDRTMEMRVMMRALADSVFDDADTASPPPERPAGEQTRHRG